MPQHEAEPADIIDYKSNSSITNVLGENGGFKGERASFYMDLHPTIQDLHNDLRTYDSSRSARTRIRKLRNQFLLENSHEPNTCRAFLFALLLGHGYAQYQLYRDVLAKDPTLVFAYNSEGRTLLMIACLEQLSFNRDPGRQKNILIIAHLLQYGAKSSARAIRTPHTGRIAPKMQRPGQTILEALLQVWERNVSIISPLLLNQFDNGFQCIGSSDYGTKHWGYICLNLEMVPMLLQDYTVEELTELQKRIELKKGTDNHSATNIVHKVGWQRIEQYIAQQFEKHAVCAMSMLRDAKDQPPAARFAAFDGDHAIRTRVLKFLEKPLPMLTLFNEQMANYKQELSQEEPVSTPAATGYVVLEPAPY